MKSYSCALAIAAAVAVTLSLNGVTKADSIGYSISSTIPANSSTQGIDLTAGGTALDWMAFVGENPAPGSNTTYNSTTMPVWDGTPSGGTESITPPTNAAVWNQGSAGPYVQYTNGTSSSATGLSFVTSDYVWNWNTPGTTFTQKLIQSNETLTMPVISFDNGSTSPGVLQVAATLTNSANTQTASLPATTIAASEMNLMPSGLYDGMLTLNVAGTAGDTLSISIGEPSGGNAGIFGVTVLSASPAPEPSTCAILIGTAIGGLVLAKRRRANPS